MARVATVIAAAVLSTIVAIPAMAAAQDDPLYLGWPSYLPAVPGDFTASTERECVPGSLRCVDVVVREMTHRWNDLGCDHDAVFALTYLRTTEAYRQAAADPTFFHEPSFVNHEDAVFADFYFDAYDNWQRARLERVAPAWRIAFHAAERQAVKGTGNMLLGMNAHINRDLPFALYAIGLTGPDGTSRKPDQDKVNQILSRVAGGPMQAELARRYDATMDDGDVPGTSLDATASMQLIQSWREEAWRKAERLRDAGSTAERQAVAQLIEDDAAAKAMALRTAFQYTALDGSARTARDSWCQNALAG